MTPKSFVSTLAATELPSVFNPWRDRCTVHDRSDAAARRRDNLEMLLTAAILSNSLNAAIDRKSTRLNSSHTDISRMPSSA